MLKLLSLVSLAAVCQAVAIYHPAWSGSSAYQTKDGIGNYAFGYHDDRWGAPSYHSESGDAAGRKVGSYGVHDADGTVRVVNYVADAGGFRADVKKLDDVKHPVAVPVVAHAAPLWNYGHGYPVFGVPHTG